MGNAGSSSSSSSSNKKHKQKEKRITVEPGKLEIKNHDVYIKNHDLVFIIISSIINSNDQNQLY